MKFRHLPWLAALLPMAVLAFDWSQFRGPNASGVSDAVNLPATFGEKNIVWKTALPPGHSSPSVTSDRVFISAIENDHLYTFALDRANGKILWRREAPRPRRQELQESNSPVTATPVSDGRNVYVFFAEFGLLAYGPDGNELWRMPLGPFNNPFGHGSSPVLAGDKLLMPCDQDDKSFFLAVNKNTGKVIWRVERPLAQRGYSTPVLYTPPSAKPQVLLAGSYRLTGYDLETGKELWYIRELPWQIKPTPVIGDGTVFFLGFSAESDPGQQENVPPFEQALAQLDTNKDGKLAKSELRDPRAIARFDEYLDLDDTGFLEKRDWDQFIERRHGESTFRAFKLGGEGDLTKTNFLWKNPRSLPNVPSPLFYKGVVYTLKEGGIFSSYDVKTGEILKQARLGTALGDYYASPIAADGRIYTLSEEGKLTVIRAGAQWEIESTTQLDAGSKSTIAVADRRMYVRTYSSVYCFEKRD